MRQFTYCNGNLMVKKGDPMFEFDLDNVQFADIKVIGCGGGGGNAVNRMVRRI